MPPAPPPAPPLVLPIAAAVLVNDLAQCTRMWFGWANSMLVAFVEAAAGLDCDEAAERQRIAAIKVRGWGGGAGRDGMAQQGVG